jgi:2-phospho-L-lactate transferase/gluconeogenesis factor (CofD/UPF0052 family)
MLTTRMHVIPMSKHNVKITVMRDGDGGEEVELEVEVSGDATELRPGKTMALPEHCYPDEGGETEVTGSWVNGEEFELTHEEVAEAEEALKQAAADAAEDAAIDRYEYREYMRDL